MRTLLAVLVGLATTAAPLAVRAQGPPVRIFVQTDAHGDENELAARKASVADLVATLIGKRQTIALVPDDDEAQIVLDVLSRGFVVPKVIIGLSGRPGQPGTAGPVRTPVLSVRLIAGERSLVFTNKNKPSETARGWKSAADDIGNQIEGWVAKNMKTMKP